MYLFNISDKGVEQKKFVSKNSIVNEMHRLGNQYFGALHHSKLFTIDMDGVLIHDDNAVMTANIVAGDEAMNLFSQYANLNVTAVLEGKTSYCWYAPTVFVGQLLKGLSPEINKVVGKHMRLIPGVENFFDILLGNLDYEVTAVTAGHQDAADEISKRIGIPSTIGTLLGTSNELYDGTVLRFIGGKHKLEEVNKILSYDITGKYYGVHVGDSWSDVETLREVPNSIAFNPGCELALRNAKISVVGLSLFGLLPFFDEMGRYDSLLDLKNLPESIITIDTNTSNSVAVNQFLEDSKVVKKQKLEEYVSRTQIPLSQVQANIINELTKKNIDFHTKQEQFMNLSEFDKYAKNAYEKLFSNALKF